MAVAAQNVVSNLPEIPQKQIGVVMHANVEVPASALQRVDLGSVPMSSNTEHFKTVFTASLLDADTNRIVWKKSRQVCLLCSQVTAPNEHLHLYVADRWLVK